MSEGSYDDRFAALEEESRGLVSDVHELALFTKLNFTGFIKIVKVRVSLGIASQHRD
jgi:SPX domain protein involved in polyphosphate accumulation